MFIVPVRSKSKELGRIEPVVLHDPDVADEASESLDETNLAVCH